MPTRMIDGDALWRSDKLSKVEPPPYRAEYANLIPLALADGYFECNPRRVWADVYSYNRSDITVQIVEDILDEFERVGLLSRKSDEKGKVWGFWTGIESRLPCESQRDRYKQGKPNGINVVAVSGQHPDTILNGLDWIGKDRIGKESATDADSLFKQAKRVYRRFVGKSLGSLGPRAGEWNSLVKVHGETVLSALEMWAQEGGKGLRGVNWPLAVFLKNADEFLEAVSAQTKEMSQTEESDLAAQAAITLGREVGRQEFETRHAAVRAENEITEPMPLDQF